MSSKHWIRFLPLWISPSEKSPLYSSSEISKWYKSFLFLPIVSLHNLPNPDITVVSVQYECQLSYHLLYCQSHLSEYFFRLFLILSLPSAAFECLSPFRLILMMTLFFYSYYDKRYFMRGTAVQYHSHIDDWMFLFPSDSTSLSVLPVTDSL